MIGICLIIYLSLFVGALVWLACEAEKAGL
jgi:hypothetical protein